MARSPRPPPPPPPPPPSGGNDIVWPGGNHSGPLHFIATEGVPAFAPADEAAGRLGARLEATVSAPEGYGLRIRRLDGRVVSLDPGEWRRLSPGDLVEVVEGSPPEIDVDTREA